jgi:hypothetical protein
VAARAPAPARDAAAFAQSTAYRPPNRRKAGASSPVCVAALAAIGRVAANVARRPEGG